MDTRQTFANVDELLSIVTLFLEDEQQVALLIDENGLTRLEGKIIGINRNDDINETTIIIDDREVIKLKNIIAVNGTFRSDYSEC